MAPRRPAPRQQQMSRMWLEYLTTFWRGYEYDCGPSSECMSMTAVLRSCNLIFRAGRLQQDVRRRKAVHFSLFTCTCRVKHNHTYYRSMGACCRCAPRKRPGARRRLCSGSGRRKQSDWSAWCDFRSSPCVSDSILTPQITKHCRTFTAFCFYPFTAARACEV